MFNLKTTPFHERTSALCQPQNWRKWAGYFVAGSYEHVLDREYWAIRNSAALIDFAPLIKYIIKGKDAAALLHRRRLQSFFPARASCRLQRLSARCAQHADLPHNLPANIA